jgi:histidine triad (HIT) family protein
MTDCIFCKIVAKEIPSSLIYEDEDVYAFADIHPVNLGHTLVIPKLHATDIYSTPDGELGKVVSVAKKVAEALKTGLQAEGVNIIMNNGLAAGQLVNHAHVHVIPRYSSDGFHHWKGEEKSMEEVALAAKKVATALSME